MPHGAFDPVVLAAMIVARLQTVVSREVAPGEPAVLTVGSIAAGLQEQRHPRPRRAAAQSRTYNDRTRSAILEAIERIVRAECQASGSPREPEFKLFDRYPRHPGPRRRRPRLAATVTGCRLDGDT